jgi:hypothetical protein
MMSEAAVANIIAIKPIFLRERLMGYHQAQVDKSKIQAQISSLIKGINQNPTSYEEIEEVVEYLHCTLKQVNELREKYENLEDDYPTVGKEDLYSDGVAI